LQNKHLGKDCEDNLSLYDSRTRNKHYISPEQIEVGNELAQIVMRKNGLIEEDNYDIQEFLLRK
jgi:hypothetical protein